MLPDAHPFLFAAIGGVLIGCSAGALYLLTGRIAGVSNIFGSAILGRAGGWRWAFLAGLIVAGAGASFIGYPGPAVLKGVDVRLLAIAGLLVGFGAKLANGCTSGHGVCGLSRLSVRSFVAVAVFMTIAAAVVFATHHLGSPS